MENNLKDRYRSFFCQRDLEKKAVYGKVVYFGWSLVGVGSCCLIFGNVLWQMYYMKFEVLLCGIIIAGIGGFMNTSGLSLCCTVPTDEFDIDDLVTRKKWIGIAASIGVGLCFFCFSLVCAFLPPHVGIGLIPLSFWMMSHSFTANTRIATAITTKINVLWTIGFVPVFCSFAYFGMNPLAFARNSFVLAESELIWAQLLSDKIQYSQPLFLFNATLFFISSLKSSISFLRTFPPEYWSKVLPIRINVVSQLSGTAAVYEVWICWMLSLGISCFVNGFFYQFYGLILVSNTGFISILFGMYLLLPAIMVIIYTPKKCFGLVARSFELNMNRLQNDGALLASLASSSGIINSEQNIWWLWRANTNTNFSYSNDSKFVNRRFFVKGKIEEGITNDIGELFVTVSWEEDTSTSWESFYNDVKLNHYVCDVVHYNKLDFHDWLSYNFENERISSKSSGIATIRVQIPSRVQNCDALKLRAVKNLRLFHWENFTNDLLLKSPRELADNEEKDQVYSLSKSVTVTGDRNKIDFFISHSWADNPPSKIKALRQFSDKFKIKNGRFPTFWFDKVCIDQRNPNDSIEVLPINIGACKKLLLLISDTYMKRLWCVWELFTLFTFCNKELAMERIEVLQISGTDVISELKSFSLDQAHCFDPNEEYKLRRIMHDIGVDRVETSIRELGRLMEESVSGESPWLPFLYEVVTRRRSSKAQQYKVFPSRQHQLRDNDKKDTQSLTPHL